MIFPAIHGDRDFGINLLKVLEKWSAMPFGNYVGEYE